MSSEFATIEGGRAPCRLLISQRGSGHGPSCFALCLQVDDLKETSQLEEYVAKSCLILLFLSREYFASQNCLRELYAAMAEDKPVVRASARC